MRTTGRKTSRKLSLPQSRRSGKVSMRWHAPNINYPKQKRFCQTKEDFHEEYGLSLEGENPTCLGNADVPENQWLTVFTHKHVNNKKIHLKLVRPEFYEECALLYHMVYQRIPPNNEITVKFARGFAFEKCRLAQSSTKKAKHKVAWAVFAESVIKNITLRKNIHTKMALWRTKNSPFDASTISASHIKQDSSDTSLGDDPSQSGQPCSQYDKAHLIQPACLVHTELAVDMVSAANEKLKEKESLVVDCRVSIDVAKTKRDKAIGVRGAADALLQKINRAKEELQALEGKGDEALTWRLRAEIMGCQVALDLLVPDVHSSTLDKAVEELQDLHNRLLKEVEEAKAQFSFVNDLVKQVEKKRVPTLALAPPVARHSTKGTLVVQDECVACGLSLEDSEVVGVYMLPCRHPYHPLCFATMCYTREGCVQIGCSQSIFHSARQIVLGCPGKFSERSMLKVEAPCETKLATHLAKTPSSRKHGYNGCEISAMGFSHKPILQPEPVSAAPIVMDGTSLISIGGKGKGDTLNSHGGAAGGEELNGEDDNVGRVQFESRDSVQELLSSAKECLAELRVAAALAEANGKKNVLQHADGEHKKDLDLSVAAALAEANGKKNVLQHADGDDLKDLDLSVAAALAEANGKKNVLQHADGDHKKDHDSFQHMTLNQIANMGTKKRKGTQKEKASKKHKNMVSANTVT